MVHKSDWDAIHSIIMGETGKRSRHHRDNNENDEKYQKRRVNNKEGSGDGELVVYRILCPGGIIGSVIGKGGKVINSLRQETRARIKVVDPFPGADERVILIYCYVKDKDDNEVDEDDSKPVCAAQDALLRVHSAIANAVAVVEESDKKHKEEAHMLVPSSQVANVIGKSGSTIKKLRTKTRTNIKVTPKDPSDPTHACAMSFDNFVQITGDAGAVKKALFSISAIMFKFSPKEEISLDTTVPDLPPSIIIPSDVPIYPTGGFYPGTDAVVPPPRSVPPVVPNPHLTEFPGYSDTGSAWPVYPSTVPAVSGYGGSSRFEELVVRLLCPSDQIGRVIGKGGSSIKSVRQASGARVEVQDTKGDCDECVIIVTSTESTDDLKSTAVEAVLLLQGKINDNDENDTVNIRFLVPSKVIGCLIGKSGSIINEMRKSTRADVRISKSEKPKCANDDDELVEVIGEVGNVRDALVQIVLRLRDDVLKDREGYRNAPPPTDSLYSGGRSVSSVLPNVPPVAPLGYDQRVETGSSLGMLSTGSLYGYGSYQVGENGYGSIPSYSSKPYGGLPSTLEIVIPAHAVGKVMGKGGANIGNIRKISGAVVEIVDSKTSRSERIAQISGMPEQKRSAEDLIQAFILAT
ncbi:KH domain-containing protein At4g18375-like isoform X2 [Magnolia sinica]|uniref:KH domain-containing protein At4g18375-like isoform X2 n=1 Tax=Magnolia sinica TaxID=86752 RepID=UPI0026594FF2|nr:KH domain-containing protein At4g18375-like isoform X2 [Magnolia sinica]